MDPDGGGSASADGPKTDFAGVRLDEGYVLIERLGVGRVGELWEASAPEGPSNVGIQLLLPALSRSGRHVRRFLSAARAGATLQHSNIVPVMNCGQVPNGPVYLARELLDGVRLRRVLAERGGLSWARAKPLLLQMLEAIEVAHADGVVHGGLEPARCWLVGDGEPESSTLKVTGFTLFGGAGSPWPLDKPYRAPELDDEETEPDTSTDVYAAGTVAYEMLSGMEWSGEAVTKTAGLCEIVPDVPPRVDRVIARALNLDRTRRYPDGKTLLAAFRRAAGVKPPPAAKTAAPKVAPPAPRAPVASPILGPIAATYESPESTLASEAAAVEAMQRSNAPASSEAAPGRALDRGPSAGEGFPPFDGGPLPSPQLAPPSAALLGRPAAAGPAAVGPDYGALSRGPVSEPSVPATPHYPTPALSRPLPAAPQRPLGHQPLGQPTPSVQQQPSHAQSRPQPRVQQPLGQPTPSVQQHGVSQQPNPMLSTPQPLGQQPLGQQPLGQQPLGQQPLGQQPLGQQPLGQQPLGQPTPSVSQQPSPAHSRPTPSVPQRAVSQQPSPAPSVPPPSVEHTTRPMPSPPMTQPPRPSIPSRPGTSELSRRGTSATPGAPAAPIRAPGSLGRLGASAL
ncbi:MAG: protein kinase, partial [Deltaproteobacteria bacterium]|nr:protein kinase [Deltaproteobacteria bacterium]